MNKYLAIKLVNITKKYVFHHEKPTLVEKIVDRKNETFIALNKINLEIKKGERVAIIGFNGSGKTTLLKIITRITNPTSGSVFTDGKIVSLIDLGAGFHPDLTGIQNIYLNGMILGMHKGEIDAKLKDIISFADIGKFIDTPIYTYSSGMLLRLGFSVAINADPEILVLDENISVGDKDFKEKSLKVLDKFLSEERTIIIASHDLDFVRRNCKKAILLKKGKVVAEGPVKNIINRYKNMV